MISDLWTRLDPGFLDPIWLIIGFFAVVAIILLEIGARRRRKQAVRLFAASHLVQALTASVSPAKRLLKSILLIVAVAFLFITLARPHLFFGWREEDRTGLDLLLAVDCSKSMLTEDVKPSRLERAKLAIADFADRLPDNRLGLIAFAGDAFLQCPLTLDRDAFQSAVRELDTDTIPRPGTDIATAIDQAVLALKSQPGNTKLLILVTDGEDLEGRVLDAARSAAQSGLKIYTVGVGTPNGGLIPERDETGAILYLHDSSGQIVDSKLDENSLRQIASITGGAYVQLGQRGEGLEEIYNRYIATLPKQHLEERREKIRFERFEWPLTLAILLLMWEFMTNERAQAQPPAISPGGAPRPIRRRPRKNANALAATPLLALGLLLSGAFGPAHAATADIAERDYKSGKYDDALHNYQQAVENQPDRNDLQYNCGAAAYKSGEFPEAEQAFRKSLETPDLDLQEKAYYNLGNAQFRHGEQMQKADTKRTIDLWEHALGSYEDALKLKKSDDAQYNYDLVKKKLEQLKQQQQQQQQQQKNNPSKPQKEQSGQNPSPDQNKGSDQDKDQQDQNNPNNPQNNNGDQNQPQAPPQQPGDQPQGQGQQPPGSPEQDKNGQQPNDQQNGQQPQGQGGSQGNTPQSARSQGREQDPGVTSRQQAENLLDSLKDDEKHVTARSLNSNNQPPPPPNSGKDW